MTSRDASQKAAAKEATNIFQNHYPEFLVRPASPTLSLSRLPLTHPPLTFTTQSRKFFINVPTVLTWIYWLFKPLVSAATLAKMTVVGQGPKTIAPELLPIIDAKELPKRYGGEAAGWDEAKA